MQFIKNAEASFLNRCIDATRSFARPTALGLLGLAALLVAASAAAQKPPTLIRQHLLEAPDMEVAQVKSVEPHRAKALDAVLSTGVWKGGLQKRRTRAASR